MTLRERLSVGSWCVPPEVGCGGATGVPWDVTLDDKYALDYGPAFMGVFQHLLPLLTPDNRDIAVSFARLPEHIRGYGYVKARNLASVRAQWQALQAQFPSAT